MTQPPLLVLAAGGTGGHMFPAQAVAEVMLARGWRVVLSTDARGARYTGGFPSDVVIEQVSSATFAKGGLMSKILVPIRIALGITTARRKMRRDRPNVVVGFGGYPAIPAMGAATSLGVPCMLHEQNGVLGRVNQLFAPRVNQIACGTWPTELPHGLTGHHVGNPVRAEILARHAAGYIEPGDHPMSLLVIGGRRGRGSYRMWCLRRLRYCQRACSTTCGLLNRPAKRIARGCRRPMTIWGYAPMSGLFRRHPRAHE